MSKVSIERKHLMDLTQAVGNFLTTLDRLMRTPSTIKRGQDITQLCNALELTNDLARHFGLGIDLRTGKKVKP